MISLNHPLWFRFIPNTRTVVPYLSHPQGTSDWQLGSLPPKKGRIFGTFFAAIDSAGAWKQKHLVPDPADAHRSVSKWGNLCTFFGSFLFPFEFSLGSLWFPFGFPLVSLWFPFDFPSVSLWFPFGFPLALVFGCFFVPERVYT